MPRPGAWCEAHLRARPAADAPRWYEVVDADGQRTGAVFVRKAAGLWGTIEAAVGMDAALARFTGLAVIDQNETPGLGNKIQGESFTRQFQGKALSSSRWEVKKRQGDFDQITAATISSKAVIRGVQEGLTLYQANVQKILKTD